MKNQLLFQKKYNKGLVKYIFVLSFLFSISSLFGQEVTVTKTAIENSSVCNQFDITLQIIGDPPPQPQEVVLVIDLSGSMARGSSPTPIDIAKTAAKDFVNQFFDNDPTGSIGNRISIVTFSYTALTVLELTADDGIVNGVDNGRSLALAAIDDINITDPFSRTNTEDGLLKADEELTTNGTFDCATSRSIILLSDGVPTSRNGGSDCSSTSTITPCQTEAIDAGEAAWTTDVLGVTYDQNVFTIGLIGAIDNGSAEENLAISTLTQIQNAGVFITENNADLTGIYSAILNQLVAAATQLPSEALVTDKIPNGFSYVAGSISTDPGNGSGSIDGSGSIISWDLDKVFKDTYTLKYSVQANVSSCGVNSFDKSIIKYQDSFCTEQTIEFGFDNICVPCLEPAPADITYQCIEDVPAPGDLTVDNCAGVNFNVTGIDSTDNSDPCNIIITRTWTLSTSCSNSSSVSQTITVSDTTAPVLDNTAGNLDANLECSDAAGITTALALVPTATDNCTTPIINIVSDNTTVDPTCANAYVQVRVWNFTDACGNTSANFTQTITVSDNTATVIDNTNTNNIEIECGVGDTQASLTAWLSSNAGATATDNCGSVTWTNDYGSDTSVKCDNGAITVIFTAQDECGNTSNTSATYLIKDTDAPTITLQASNETVECDGTGNTGDLNTWLTDNGGATATDTCSAVSWSNDFTTLSDDCGLTGTSTVTFTATDACGNTSTTIASFTIIDITNPTLNVPADVTVECTADTTSANTGLASSTDTCGDVTITQSDVTVAGICGNTVVITRTWTATDTCGNETSANQIITTEDTSDPTLNVPADVTVECTADTTSANTGLASSTDTCGDVTITQSDVTVPGICGNTVVITRTWTATDACGNETSANQIITTEDTTDPTLNVPADVTVECTADTTSANTGLASSTDTCGDVTITQSDVTVAGICGNTVVITRTWTATDTCGNETSANQIITTEDTSDPTLNVPADVTVECTADTTSANTGLASSTDTCGDVTITQSDVTVPGICGNTVVITRTWTATDTCGNETSANQIITTEDTSDPTLNVPADVTVECTADTTSANTGLATGSDTCGDVTITQSDVTVPGICGNTVVITRTWTATDACGNETSADQIITTEDTTAPEIDNTNTTDIEIECGVGDTQAALAAWLTNYAGATATDSCGTVTWSNNYGSDDSVKCDNGAITVVFTATDACGNMSVTEATYLIKDTDAPIINTQASNLIVECDGNGNIGDLNTWLTSNGNATATDSCSNVIWSNDFTTLSDDCGLTGSATVTFTATDACGNTNSTIATFTIVDTTPPSAPSAPANMAYECIADVPAAGNITAIDICGGAISVIGIDITDNSNSCNIIITRTWTFTDDCNNTSKISQTITVKDTTPPILTLPANVSAECSDDLTPIAFGNATATDNCDPSPIVTFTDKTTDGACPGSYIITRTWIATDSCGNIATADQTISTSDTTAPDFVETVLPQNITIECDSIPTAEILTATDNCGTAAVTVNDVISNRTCANNYIITRIWTATDECSLTRTHTQIITVQDTNPPAFVETLPPTNLVVECDAVPTAQTLTATDVCGPATVSVSDIRTNGNCNNNYTLARTWTAKDECGNETKQTQIIVVRDTKAPLFVQSLPRDITVECDAVPNAETLTATDNCGNANVTVMDVKTNGDCPNNYIVSRTWTATDECGLKTTHTQIITVQDTKAPVPAVAFDEVLNVSCTDIPDAPSLTFTDNCSSNIIVVFNETSTFQDNVYNDYQIERTWTVRDECSNEAVYKQILNVALDEIVTQIVAEDRCFDDGIVNMNDLLPSTLNTNGTWELLEGNPVATLTGSIFNPTLLELSADFLPGDGGKDYLFKYTTTDQGCISITEVTMNINANCVVLPCGENDVVISKAVTPNGDAYNEFFEISGIELCGFVFDVKIFNRWGALIFESDNYQNNWNGTSSKSSIGASGKVPNGTYYYILILKDSGLPPYTGPVYLGTN